MFTVVSDRGVISQGGPVINFKKTLLLVFSALILLGAVLTFKFMVRQAPTGTGQKAESAPGEFGSWPIFRGDRQLTGYAKVIPAKVEVSWRFRAKASVNGGPVASDGKLFFGDSEGTLYCLDIYSGKSLWQKKISDGFSAPALLVDGVCYIGSQSGVFYALSMDDGKEIWQYKCSEQINGSANYFRQDGQLRIIFGCYDFQLRCLDGKAGKVLWAVKTGNYINGAPAIDDMNIIFGGCDGYIRYVDCLSGKEMLKVKLKSYIPASPAVFDATTFAATYDNNVYALNREGKILWSFDSGNDSAPFLASPAVNNKVVVVGDRDGVVYILSRKEGKKLNEFQAGGDIIIGPVVSDDMCIVADKEGYLYCFDLDSATEKWRHLIGTEITASILISDKSIIVADNDGNITHLSQENI